MEVKIINQKISQQELKEIAQSGFGRIVKLAVDIEKEVVALGGEWHSECQEVLIKDGSQAQDVWGCNIHTDRPKSEWLEFFALINIKPSLNNRNMEIQNPEIKQKIKEVVDNLIE